MLKECNGLIFEYNKGWNLLAMPQLAFCTTKIAPKKLEDLHKAGSYDIYEVLDATILTLYFYQAEWHLSSTKGYDIGNMDMTAEMSYMQVLQHLIDTKYPSFKLDDLNQAMSYTIALRYSEYHIFDETRHLEPQPDVDMNSYVMIMCVADLATMRHVDKSVAGLPQQTPLDLQDTSIRDLHTYARSAYTKYAKAHRVRNFKYKPLFGYILRARLNSVPNEYSTIYIESEMFKSIKAGLYCDNHALRAKNYKYLIAQLSTNHERYTQFRVMFPQFKPIFDDLDDAIDLIAEEAANRIAGEVEGDPTEFVKELVEQFKSEPDVTADVITDAIFSKRYTEHLSKLLD
ncbi:hypothetical protein PHYBOEH_005564 [Phytophthora boehmeriae]|uniref:Uncharacterized protein n=1 Tax=Phytophthora boehmeriae TaxID=109152 RepID=A0A8T1WQT5_9STRA|nr:hypothetical protein PHYBOEH_005564 [Phytophthora boehmeriae]